MSGPNFPFTLLGGRVRNPFPIRNVWRVTTSGPVAPIPKSLTNEVPVPDGAGVDDTVDVVG